MPATLLRTFVCALLLVVGWATSQSARAEDVKPPAPSSGHLSGYDRVPRLGGPDSTHSALRRHDQKKDATFRLHVAQDALAPYYRFKKRLKDRAGLSFGIDYNVLYQVASAGLTEDEAAGGALRFYGNWILLGRGTPNTGSFVFRVENRHRLGTAIAPRGLAQRSAPSSTRRRVSRIGSGASRTSSGSSGGAMAATASPSVRSTSGTGSTCSI